MLAFKNVFPRAAANVIGMVHALPMPATPLYEADSVDRIVERATAEAKLYDLAGVDGVIVENMWDAPYVTATGPEVTAVMTVVCSAVRAAVRKEIPVGVQVTKTAKFCF